MKLEQNQNLSLLKKRIVFDAYISLQACNSTIPEPDIETVTYYRKKLYRIMARKIIQQILKEL